MVWQGVSKYFWSNCMPNSCLKKNFVFYVRLLAVLTQSNSTHVHVLKIHRDITQND